MSSVIGSINIRKAVSMSNQRYCFFDLPECLNIYVYKDTSIAAMHVLIIQLADVFTSMKMRIV